MKLMAGNSNLPLARAIAGYLEIPLTDASVRRFADEEVFVEIHENVRGEDVFVLQSTSFPANDNLMELLICIDALKRASARRITAVVPYFGYARQDRKPGPRTPISAKLVANLITQAGADRVLAVDLHAGQIQGFFDIPTDNLFAAPVMAADIQARYGDRDLMVVSPDVGGLKMAWGYAKRLGARLAVVEKRRLTPTDVETGFVIGEVEGKNVILVDDILATGGSMVEAANTLKRKGAASLHMCVTHPVMCGKAVDILPDAPFASIVTTDTIPLKEKAEVLGDKLTVLSVADLLGEAVHRIHSNRSVSYLFNME